MKIGILTFHSAHNYGAVLQAYALLSFLRSKGLDASIIDYRPSNIEKNYNPYNFRYHWFSKNPIKCIRKILASSKTISRNGVRYRKFNSFIENKLSPCSIDLGSSVNDFDSFVFGSDQIWNPEMMNKLDKVFWGNFKAADSCRKIAYAASAGNPKVLKNYTSEIEKYLSEFDAISVREKSLKTFLQPMVKGKDIESVLDPTLIVSRDAYDAIALQPKVKKKYVLIYELSQVDDRVRFLAKQIAKSLDAEVINICKPNAESKDYIKDTLSPEEFLGYFKYAEFVLTSSFHGTAFSVIFRKPFYSIHMDPSTDARTSSFLSDIDLEDRYIFKDKDLIFLDGKPDDNIDWDNVSLLLSKKVRSSRNFLLNAIEI